MGCALVGGSWFVAATTTDIVYRIVGWFGVAFFGLAIVIAFQRLLRGGAPFVFELAGIVFADGDFGLLPWNEIKEYQIVAIRGNEFLALTFRDPERVLSRVSTAKRRLAITNERLGWGHWALSFSGVSPGLHEAVAFIRDHSLVPLLD